MTEDIRTVFLLNLPWTVEESVLAETLALACGGAVASVKIARLRDGRGRGGVLGVRQRHVLGCGRGGMHEVRSGKVPGQEPF